MFIGTKSRGTMLKYFFFRKKMQTWIRNTSVYSAYNRSKVYFTVTGLTNTEIFRFTTEKPQDAEDGRSSLSRAGLVSLLFRRIELNGQFFMYSPKFINKCAGDLYQQN